MRFYLWTRKSAPTVSFDVLGSEKQLDMMNKRNLILASLMILTIVPTAAFGSSLAGHADPIPRVLLALIVILLTAKLGGEAAERLGLPAVLGELLGGMILGNLILLNPAWSFFQALRTSPLSVDWAVIIGGLAQLGVIILLFEVGLESTVQGMMKVGASSFLVASLGVVVPFLLGFGVSWLFIKEIPRELAAIVPGGFSLNYVHMFIGAILCATSVGITARVFKDLKRLQMKEARIILGAAVIDDVLGLIVLAVISGIITSAESGQPMAVGSMFRLVAVAVFFLGAALAIGTFLIPRILKQLARLRTAGVMLISALLFAFALSYLADAVGLAPIVGAFAAGLILEEVHFSSFREDIRIEQLIRPVSTFLVPIFFVLMGIQVHWETFANPAVFGIAACLTLAAIVGKQACGLGILEKKLDRLTVGIGMIPRGEVGLIFVNMGRDLRVLDDATLSAAVIMIIITTLITPPLLKFTLAARKEL
jgi:Kef-type K+ transport system membrane component KefB